jgi:murein DD-endopeptidase MepM/ murein hydrolase activator NlpD
MKQNYFIVVLAHSLHGRLRRIHVPQQFVYVVLGLALLGGFSLFGVVSSYVRMAWKVANYNSLREEVKSLRTKYRNLQLVANETNEQLATLQMFAKEVSMAYGIKQKIEGPADITSEGRLLPTFHESVEDYNFLRSANILPARRNPGLFRTHVIPSLWPVEGHLQGPWGSRIDPFSGEGAFHKGVDISAPTGTPVRAAADGVIVHAEQVSGYGRLIVVDHGNGIQTYYAHLSKFFALSGREVRRGEIIGAIGTSGRTTAPHLHYEVRQRGTPVNPHNYLVRSPVTLSAAKRDFPF